MNRITQFINHHRDEVILFVIAIALYLPGIGWGIPYATHHDRIHGWATDAITPLGPFTEVYHLIRPEGHAWLPYPLMHYFVLIAVFTPYILYLFLTGNFVDPTPTYPFGFADPVVSLQVLEYLGKTVALCMAAGVVVGAYHIAKALWSRTAGWIAAVLTMLLYPMIYYAKTGTLDVPVLFWTVLGVSVFTNIVQNDLTVRRAVWLGACAAFATATKDQGWAAFALMPPAMVFIDYRRKTQIGRRMSLKPYLAGAAVCVIAYLITTGTIINPSRHLAHLQWVRDHVPLPFQKAYPATFTGYSRLLAQTLGHMADSAGILALAAAAVGICLIYLKDRRKLVLLIPPMGYFLGVIALVRVALFRHVLFLSFMACIFAAYALARDVRSPHAWQQRLAWSLLVLICAWQFVRGADLTYQMVYDSRYAAADWLDQHTESGDLIATTGAVASLPRTKPGVESFSFHHTASAVELINQRRPLAILVMPNWTTPKGGLLPVEFPHEVYQTLLDGSLGYRKVARFQTSSLVKRQILDYPTVNPPIQIFVREEHIGERTTDRPWHTKPHRMTHADYRLIQ